jgi:phage FluMu gp28-like protein
MTIEDVIPRLVNALEMPAYQRAAISVAARFTWNNWSRQTGKSFTFSLRRLIRGLLRRRNQIFLSAGERQSRELMDKVRQHCQTLQIACEFHDTECFEGTRLRKLEAVLPGGVRIIGLPANPMTARGFTGDVFLDEFAMHRDDRAIWAALFPTLLRGRGELDVASTPRGRKNVFFRLRNNPRFAQATVTIHDAAAAGLPVDLDEIRAALGDEETFRQEFECEFVDEATAFMPHALITSCQDVTLSTAVDDARLAAREACIFAGVDVGRMRDLTVVWLWEQVGEAFVTRGVIEMARTSFAVQRRVIESLLSRPAVRRCCVDAGGLGMQLAEELTAHFGAHCVESIHLTAAVKSDLAGRLRVWAERGVLRIPVDDAIRHDWHSIERVVTPAGHVRYDAERGAGGHADRFWAAALGLHAAGQPTGKPEYVAGRSLTFARPGAW